MSLLCLLLLLHTKVLEYMPLEIFSSKVLATEVLFVL